MSNAEFRPYGISAEQYDEIAEHLARGTKIPRLLIQKLVIQGKGYDDAYSIVHKIKSDLDASPSLKRSLQKEIMDTSAIEPKPLPSIPQFTPAYHPTYRNPNSALQDQCLSSIAMRGVFIAIFIVVGTLFNFIKPQSNIEKAGEYYEQGDFAQAAVYYEKALLEEPNDPSIHNNLGVVYMEIGEYEKSLTALDKAIELDNDFEKAYESRCSTHLELENYGLARADCTKAISLGSRVAYTPRCAANYELGYYEEALADCNQSIFRYPRLFDGYLGRALVHNALGNPEDAIEDFNRAIELDETFSDLYFGLGAMYYQLGESAKSLENFKRYAELAGNDAIPEVFDYIAELEATSIER